MPPDDPGEHPAFLDGVVERGHTALELPFVKDFPWKEKQCRAFGELAAERNIQLSVHAPYFAVLTVIEEDRGKQAVSAMEHTMKLGAELGAPVIVAHLGAKHGEDPEVLTERAEQRLESIRSKVEDLGVGLGLETAGNDSSFGGPRGRRRPRALLRPRRSPTTGRRGPESGGIVLPARRGHSGPHG
jgi:sugar phosphate isomerase/epimerase